MMRAYVQYDLSMFIVHAELKRDGKPGEILPSGLVDVTDRMDGPFVGRVYDAGSDTFMDYVKPEARPLAIVKIYDPADVTKAEKLSFLIAEDIGIDVVVESSPGKPMVGFSGAFGIPIMRYDPVLKGFTGTVKRLGLTFTAGVASRTIAGGFAQSGDYGIDERVSDLARVAAKLIIAVIE